jgi:antitoxin (DNA-binding transcriptional repressor) of toxin-antitoxin stability system
MRFLSVRELRARPAIWRELAEVGEMVVTSNGKPVAILAPVSEAGLESFLRALRRARAAEAVERLQRDSARAGRDRLSTGEIDAEIAAVREHRRR